MKITSKGLMFATVMAALGNVLSFFSMKVAPILPNIPLGTVQVSLALDLSHLTTFIAALFGGPIVGGLTGALGGLVAAFEFGFSKGNLLTGFGLPIGKALTGLVAGLIMLRLSCLQSWMRMVISTVVSYVPEAVFTLALFVLLFPIFLGMPSWLAYAISAQIVVKAFVEMVVMGILLSFIAGNQSFRAFVSSYF